MRLLEINININININAMALTYAVAWGQPLVIKEPSTHSRIRKLTAEGKQENNSSITQ